MGYGRGDSFPFYSEPNGIQFGSKSKGKLSPRPYPIQFERKCNTSFLSAERNDMLKFTHVVRMKIVRITQFSI